MSVNTPVTMDLEPHGQPTHDAATNFLSKWVLFRFVVERVENRDRDFRARADSRGRFLLPEAISAPEI